MPLSFPPLRSSVLRFGGRTNEPAYVGGDTWGAEDMIGARPIAPAPTPDNHPLYDLKLVEHAELMDAYNADLAAWDAALEAERVQYARIPFSGHVPVSSDKRRVGKEGVRNGISGLWQYTEKK